jgi:hypothetical protein
MVSRGHVVTRINRETLPGSQPKEPVDSDCTAQAREFLRIGTCVQHTRHRMRPVLPRRAAQGGFCRAEFSRFPDPCVGTSQKKVLYGPRVFNPRRFSACVN